MPEAPEAVVPLESSMAPDAPTATELPEVMVTEPEDAPALLPETSNTPPPMPPESVVLPASRATLPPVARVD